MMVTKQLCMVTQNTNKYYVFVRKRASQEVENAVLMNKPGSAKHVIFKKKEGLVVYQIITLFVVNVPKL